jgi:two-component system, cell cycle response regulator DivK
MSLRVVEDLVSWIGLAFPHVTKSEVSDFPMARNSAKGQVDPRTRPLVLVVEDDRDCREMYVESLAYFGLRVAAASSADEALRKIRDLPPDIITTDIGLRGGMDGCEMTEKIKGNARTKAIPVIGVTGWKMNSEVERAQLAGCDSVLIKPCLPSDLLVEIQRLLKLTAKKRKK